jgi:hypothetical protein
VANHRTVGAHATEFDGSVARMAQGWGGRFSAYVRSRITPRSRADGRTSEAPAIARPAYVGDFEGVPSISYEPHDDHHPDPGEVVWAWVPYEDDHTQGKDRPALVIGRSGRYLLALPLTSKDHNRDKAQEAHAGRFWFDLGPGGWDRSGRPSEARLDRIIQLEPTAVRREGAILDQARFEALAHALRAMPRR